MISTRMAVRAGVLAVAAAGAGALIYPAPAAAHVSVDATNARQGGFSRVTFQVPTESDEASTTEVEVHLPEATPIASVAVKPVPGWTAALTRTRLPQPVQVEGGEITEAVTAVTWTARGGAGIRPGEFEEFPLSLGPLPTVDQLVFKTLQHYSDGSTVRWIEEPTPGGPEPESPAPVLKLLPPAPAGAQDTEGASAGEAAAGSGGSDSGSAALGLGIAGLVAGLGGLALGGLAFLRTRGSATPAGTAAAPAGAAPTGAGPGSAAGGSAAGGSAPSPESSTG